MRVLRYPALLVFLAAGEFVLMTILEFFYFRRLSGGLPSLDLRFLGFTAREATTWLAAIGPDGAQSILVWHYLTFDLLFPALLSLTLASLIIHFGKRLPRFAALPEAARTSFALAIVAPYAVLDYAQNFEIAQLLADPFNARLDTMLLASSFVVAKFAFGAIPFIVIALFALAGQKRFSKTS